MIMHGLANFKTKQLLDTLKKSAISAFKRPQTYALDCRVTGIDSTLHGPSQFGNGTKYHGSIRPVYLNPLQLITKR
jgi:hypothetical protein